ncbi:MAG: hypothetical protein GY869_30920 [Planctomycetes bacterium]|nr:hypothetical protein [Planctomycetota bacterium]
MKKASLIFLIIIGSVVLIGANSAFALSDQNGGSTNGGGWASPNQPNNGIETNGGQGNGGQGNGGQGNGSGQVKGSDFAKSADGGRSGLQLNAIILPGK